MATNQDSYKDMNRNPDGKGGFGDNPQHRSNGRWSKDNSFSYWLNFFKNMSMTEFKEYDTTHSEDDMSMAESLAYVRMIKARKELNEFREVADRTEGKAPQFIDVTTNGEKINVALVEFINKAVDDDGYNDNRNES